MLFRMVLSMMRGGTGSGRRGSRAAWEDNMGNTTKIRKLKEMLIRYIKTNTNPFKDFQLETFQIWWYIEILRNPNISTEWTIQTCNCISYIAFVCRSLHESHIFCVLRLFSTQTFVGTTSLLWIILIECVNKQLSIANLFDTFSKWIQFSILACWHVFMYYIDMYTRSLF